MAEAFYIWYKSTINPLKQSPLCRCVHHWNNQDSHFIRYYQTVCSNVLFLISKIMFTFPREVTRSKLDSFIVNIIMSPCEAFGSDRESHKFSQSTEKLSAALKTVFSVWFDLLLTFGTTVTGGSSWLYGGFNLVRCSWGFFWEIVADIHQLVASKHRECSVPICCDSKQIGLCRLGDPSFTHHTHL